MVILSYFELNPELNPAEIAEIGGSMMKKGLFPVEGQKILAWYITTSYWGIVLTEIDSPETAFKATNAWRIAKPGVFTVWKTGIAMKSEEAIPLLVKLGEQYKK
jgi:hypothetical protein